MPSEPTSAKATGSRTIVIVGGIIGSLVNFRGPLIARLVGAGHRVLASAPERDPEFEGRIEALGAEYQAIPMKRGGLRPDQDLATYRALVRLFLARQPDLVIAYTIKPVIWGLLAAERAGVARRFAIITGLGYAFGTGFRSRVIGQMVRRLYRRGLRNADKVFFQNPDDLHLFEDLGLVRPEQSVLVNGSGVDLRYYTPQPLPETPTFLLIARFLVEKGVRDYVDAARLVKGRHPGARFLLVGAPDASNPSSIGEAELREWIASGVIEHRGWLDDVRPAIADASVFVLPSYYREGTPRTILEALAMARPIVTTDAPGCRETVRPGINGWLVPPRDPKALAAALSSFLDDPSLLPQMATASLELAREKYDVDKVNAAMLRAMGLE